MCILHSVYFLGLSRLCKVVQNDAATELSSITVIVASPAAASSVPLRISNSDEIRQLVYDISERGILFGFPLNRVVPVVTNLRVRRIIARNLC